ncbi:hypothetical protein F1D05_10530 [Kribbella qitaiheensis]|uniref:Uncharacterized protein n=1 Tax=Kribbella qitaiheensis TaxID=1544730 RepID=A0A7G6WW88_9ACTN|nr:hypothetical protein [Kribbella qitaiheensis]QNE18253.1 hypothetical protein F1D05_10530 [Kribbella qitaiheensis]
MLTTRVDEQSAMSPWVVVGSALAATGDTRIQRLDGLSELFVLRWLLVDIGTSIDQLDQCTTPGGRLRGEARQALHAILLATDRIDTALDHLAELEPAPGFRAPVPLDTRSLPGLTEFDDYCRRAPERSGRPGEGR